MTDKHIYTYPDGMTTPGMTDHEAIQAGFCPGCGYFIGGSEHDDMSVREFGLCYECVEELRIELGEFDEIDGYYYE